MDLTISKPFYRWTSQELLAYLRGLDRKARLKLLGGLGGGFLFLVLIVWPAWWTRPEIQNQIQALRSQIQLAQTRARLEPKLLEERKQYEAFIQEIHSRLFTEGEREGLLGILAELGEKSRVALTGSQPVETQEKIPPPFDAKYESLSYAITVEGGYHALANFVREIETYPEILRVEEFSIRPQEETPGTHLGEMRLSVFLLRKES